MSISVREAPTQEEWDALVRRHAAAAARFAKLAEEEERPLWWERAYPVNITLPLFTGTAAAGGYPAAFGELNIDAGATFFALGIEASYTASGVLTEDASPATLTIPETLRLIIFDYTWSIRDSASDGDWSNLPLPSTVIRTGNLGFFSIGGQRRLPGGTRVMFTVNPTFLDATADAAGVEAITSHSLQFVLTGVAVKDGVQW